MHTKGVALLLILLPFLIFAPSCAAREGNFEESDSSHEVATKHWAVELSSSANADEVAHAHGFLNMGPIGSLPNVYLFHEASKLQIRSASVVVNDEHPHISSSPHVTWYEKQVAKKRFRRFVLPTDPLFDRQWHLRNTVSGGVDINVIPVWTDGFYGENITIAMVDDGLQMTHPDIQPNYRADGSWDFNENDAFPTPHYGDDHGTSAGGVAAARSDNGMCGTGAAPHAYLSGIRLIADYTTDAQEAQGLSYKNQINDIYSNSWGPNDDGRRLEGPGRLTLAQMQDSIQNGRGGRGSIYVWAGGNGFTSGDNCNYDGYANSRFTITIGAIDYLGRKAYYSENCAALIACAPSSGSTKSITTTDLLGAPGTSTTDCTSTFGGTSAAAPLVAGVVALILSANPSLGWRDVQQILITTSRITDSADGDWFTNSAGLNHNHKYGFGLVNAEAAVAAARTHTNLGESLSFASPLVNVGKVLNDFVPVESTISVADNFIVETVEIIFTATHSYRGNLYITLTSPAGTPSVLQENHADRNQNIVSWTYTTVRAWGEHSAGTWVLKVEDKVQANTGTWTSWQLKVYGH